MVNTLKFLFYSCIFILFFHFLRGGRFFDYIYEFLYRSRLKETNEVLHYHTDKYNAVLNEIFETKKRLETEFPMTEHHGLADMTDSSIVNTDKPYHTEEEKDIMKRDLQNIVQSFQSFPMSPTPLPPQVSIQSIAR
jgi:hypothetical protein